MENDYFTEDELNGDSTNDNVESSFSESAESTVAPQPAGDSLTLSELNAVLGKNFTSKEAALKSFKDTYAFVGTRKDKVREEVLAELGDKIVFKDQYETDMFYKDNSEYNGMRNIIDALAKANGQRPGEVVKTDDFKKIFEGVSGYEKVQKARTVLSSNPRIASSSNHMQEAIKAANSGDQNAVEANVLSAIKEAYEM